jgi:hypothetical protein
MRRGRLTAAHPAEYLRFIGSRVAIFTRTAGMTDTRNGALIRSAAQVVVGVWAAALTALFFLAETAYVFSEAVMRSPKAGVLVEWRKALLPQLSATYQQ